MIADDFPHDLEKDKTDPNNKRESNIRHGGGGGTHVCFCQFVNFSCGKFLAFLVQNVFMTRMLLLIILSLLIFPLNTVKNPSCSTMNLSSV